MTSMHVVVDGGEGEGSKAVSKAWIAAAVVGLLILTCLALGSVYSLDEYSKKRGNGSRAGSHTGVVVKQDVEVEVNFSACTSSQRL